MFRVFYDNNGNVIYITNATEQESTDSEYNYLDVETIPERDMYRQYFKVKNNQIVVENMELTEEQERDIVRLENTIKINDYKRYLADTDYVANKLSEILAKALISGDNTELIEFNEQYEEVLATRQEARNKINELSEEN